MKRDKYYSSVFLTYLSQGYIAIIGVALVPVYIRLIGSEAYGLIGFFAVIQAWFSITARSWHTYDKFVMCGFSLCCRHCVEHSNV